METIPVYNDVEIKPPHKPVVLVHGLMTGDVTMLELAKQIEEMHPGTKTYVLNRFCGWASLEPLWKQVLELGPDLLQICSQHPEGINLIGYSQGGIIARGMLESYPNHNVHTFISLSSPQGGQYGTKCFSSIFPNLTLKTAYELFYSKMGQDISVGNYWYDPYHLDLYLKYSKYLPIINNELETSNSSNYKKGITRLKRMILIGGPDDGVISPWQSSQFAVLNENQEIVTVKERSIYKNDSFGLKTLDEAGKLMFFTVIGISHHEWYKDKSVIDNFIIKWLD
ncbi:lysosomal thioesterase PPT2 homolog isoform X2 [Daktulosphaira vitifoliae]|uniref:lysosomal thioesterase PPT2 homolog isoform X2 n=1 Tax=Daktulosphaira vitifoliae TaxID=58002 RepID=UPI0021AAE95A|nr:lysosomal thioesterase PPT2 homolog isoform X2 [Daktulosphaira vitifoliae]